MPCTCSGQVALDLFQIVGLRQNDGCPLRGALERVMIVPMA
jgi:hypothetical protein